MGRLARVGAALLLAASAAASGAAGAAPIAGKAPNYGPTAVADVPNAAAITRRIWLPELDAGFDAQGLAADAGGIYVSGYRSDSIGLHRGPCRVARIDPDSGRETGRLEVPNPCGHAGGLALGGDGTLYIADTHMLFALPLVQAFGPANPQFRRFPLGPGLVGALAVSTPDGIWLGTYREDGPGRLFRFPAAILAGLRDGEVLGVAQAAAVLTIPDNAQGAAIGAGALWVSRSALGWGTLDRLDPSSGTPQRRFRVAPGVEGIAFDGAGRLWAVSEAGARHYYDRPFAGLVEPFFPLVFAIDLSRLE
jgi:sugar lactone lactonase YvrE